MKFIGPTQLKGFIENCYNNLKENYNRSNVIIYIGNEWEGILYRLDRFEQKKNLEKYGFENLVQQHKHLEYWTDKFLVASTEEIEKSFEELKKTSLLFNNNIYGEYSRENDLIILDYFCALPKSKRENLEIQIPFSCKDILAHELVHYDLGLSKISLEFNWFKKGNYIIEYYENFKRTGIGEKFWQNVLLNNFNKMGFTVKDDLSKEKNFFISNAKRVDFLLYELDINPFEETIAYAVVKKI